MLTFCLCVSLLHSAPPADPIDDVLALLPRGTAGFLLLPDLQRASDDLEATLKGMGRAGLLFGGDPLDQLLSTLGIPLQIDTGGAAIIAWVLPTRADMVSPQARAAEQDSADESPQDATLPSRVETGADAEADAAIDPIVVAFVPAKDPQQFLELNFESAQEAGRYLHESGTMLYGRVLPDHVALSREPLDQVPPPLGREGAAALRRSWPDSAPALLQSGDVVLAGNARAVEGASREIAATLAKTPIGRALAAMNGGDQDGSSVLTKCLQVISSSSAGGVMAIDFDPLAVTIRSTAQLCSDERSEQVGDAPLKARTGLVSLPRKPYHFALSMNLTPFHRLAALRRYLPFGRENESRWLSLIQGISFAAYESPTGLRGGLLNDAVLILPTDQPEQLRDLIRGRILAINDIEDGIERSVTWREDRPIEDVGLVDVFEVRFTRVPDDRLHEQMIERLAFGPVGLNGYLYRFERGVIITFSQRPDVLRSTISAIEGGSDLSEDPIIGSMREWMAGTPDVEWYVDLVSLMEMLRRAVEFYPMLPALPAWEVQGDLPPIGFSASLHERRIDSTAIVPASVAAILFDQLTSILPAERVDEAP